MALEDDLDDLKEKVLGHGVRLAWLEGQMNQFNDQLKRNTAELQSCTRLVEGIHGQNAEMYEAYCTAKNGVKVLAKAGNGIMWTADKINRLARPAVMIIVLGGASWTGFHLPDWAKALVDGFFK